MQDILILGIGLVSGVIIGLFIKTLSYAKTNRNIEHEKLMSYKDGYKKGFDDGYDLKKSHTK